MMSREFTGGEEEPSELEIVCIEARRLVAEREVLSPPAELGDEDEILFDIDCEEAEPMMPRTPPSYHFGFNGVNTRNPFSKLGSLEEEGGDGESEENSIEEEDTFFSHTREPLPTVPKLSMSLKGVSLTEKTQRYHGVVSKGGSTTKGKNNSSSGGNQSGSRSANEQLQASVSFVKLADMSDEEWGVFLEKFQKLLPGAFRCRKCGPAGQKQRQRLGTSCQF